MSNANEIRPSGESFSFDVALAAHYGIEEALLIRHFQHWIRLNKNRQINFKDGKTWTYQTLQQIADHFPFFNYEKIKYCVENLVRQGVLIKGNYNKSPIDKTTWYAFENEEIYVPDIPIFSKNVYERENSLSMGKIPSCIPDTKTTNTKEKKEENIKKKIPTPKKEQSPTAICIYNLFLKSIKSFKPDFKDPNSKKWIDEIEQMISKDKRDPEKIKQVVEWFALAENWHKYILSAASLRKNFDRLEISMNDEKKPKQTKNKTFEKISKHFKNGETYNGKEFFINEQGITFYSGNYSTTLKFTEHGFLVQFENLLRKYNINIPKWDD